LNSQIKQATLILAGCAIVAGCHKSHPSAATQPLTTAKPAAQPVVATTAEPKPAPPPAPVDPNAGVVVHKPFIALPNNPFSHPAQPTVLLVQHARSDSPIPLSQYSRQQVHSLDSFDLHAGLSADELQKRFGLPAQLADYSNPWFVYRLTGGRELWLNFSQPDNSQLVAADEIIPVEDGYTRKRVFSIDDSH
jgi:hypothetical protein